MINRHVIHQNYNTLSCTDASQREPRDATPHRNETTADCAALYHDECDARLHRPLRIPEGALPEVVGSDRSQRILFAFAQRSGICHGSLLSGIRQTLGAEIRDLEKE